MRHQRHSGFAVPSSTSISPRWPQRLSSASALLIPALALWLPSGYSWGAALLLLGALCSLRHWPRMPVDASTRWLAAAMMLMGLVWIFLSDPAEGLGRWDRPIKFLLALPCLFFAAAYPANPRALFWGVLLGCLGAGGIALWQVFVLDYWRATGTTNAIQYGNLALQLAVMLAALSCGTLFTRGLWARPRQRGLMALAMLAMLAGCLASVLSLSRGGWLALLLALPLALTLARSARPALALGLGGAFLASMTMVAVAKPQMLNERWQRTVGEVAQFEARHGADSSIGQRLEHWRLAWDMGLEKPLLGWSVPGYMQEKLLRVQAGQYRPAILQYQHVHNEALDVFVKAGLTGVAVLGFFYLAPLCVFWPRRNGQTRPDSGGGGPRLQALQAQQRALELAGLSLPVMFAGYGITQVFYAHNSGIMFYLFMTIAVWSCLRGVRQQIAQLTASGPVAPAVTP
ncbi:O-antigen ligase family protein [Vandammella animalimorsus]|uniref:O-antigen ligase family protein n=1 Tax=Vandammella animalimorsus TaxID=2029117 RepID=UPI001EEDB1E2|nr:O-antigen ligase family protein [Vandammella animalimorsus]